MGLHTGNSGVVKADAEGGTPAALIEVFAFSVNTSSGTSRADAMGDGWEEHLTTKKSWSGSISVRKDNADADQLNLLVEGARLDVELYPEGETTGMEKITGTVILTSRAMDVQMEETLGLQFDFQGTGAMTRSAVV